MQKCQFPERREPDVNSASYLDPRKPLMILALSLAGFAVGSPARAEVLDFNLTGSRQANFELNTAVAPDTTSTSIFGDQIQYFNVDGDFGGVTETATIGFGTSIFAQLNISAAGMGFTQFAGPDLFSEASGGPQFNRGTFQLSSLVDGPSTITISEGVPEASTWVLMGLGFAGVGLMAGRRGRKARFRTA